MPRLINIRNSKNFFFPTAAFLFLKINHKLTLKNRLDQELRRQRSQISKRQPLREPGETVDVYDDLCNVFKKVQ